MHTVKGIIKERVTDIIEIGSKYAGHITPDTEHARSICAWLIKFSTKREIY